MRENPRIERPGNASIAPSGLDRERAKQGRTIGELETDDTDKALPVPGHDEVVHMRLHIVGRQRAFRQERRDRGQIGSRCECKRWLDHMTSHVVVRFDWSQVRSCAFAERGASQRTNSVAAAPPITWPATNTGTSAGDIPAKVLVAARASVTAGFANDVDEVNQ